jgi:oxygen-independent coproporphyrinogen-3 oxidase
MLRVRLREGIALDRLEPAGRHAVAGLIADGLVEPGDAIRGLLRLTSHGRLLADAVVRRLLPD